MKIKIEITYLSIATAHRCCMDAVQHITSQEILKK